MASLLLALAVAAMVAVWVRGARRSRQAWLKKLNLPGRWLCAEGELALEGQLNGGRYRLREGAREEQGRWVLEGGDLVLSSDRSAKPRRYDLRFFNGGKIGLDGPGLARRIYQRALDNVVHLGARK